MPEMDDREKQHLEDLERIKNFRLLDDDFLTKCLEDNVDGMKLMLDIILPVKLSVQRVTTQSTIKNLQGRSLRLDVVALDEKSKHKVNVEVQRDSRGAGAKRARYHGSILDANSVFAGEDFEDLPEIFVVFITEKDVLHRNKPIYRIDRYYMDEGGPVLFDDKLHIVYVNSEVEDNTPLGLLMHDFRCTNPDDMHYKILADRVRYFKQDEKGVATMCKAMEDMRKEAAQAAALMERKRMAIRMLEDGELTDEKIALYAGLTLDQVKELAQEKSA